MEHVPKSILLAALALAGCASPSNLHVTSSGSLPLAGTYRFTETAAPAQLEKTVTTHLRAVGFAWADQPQYLVQVASFERPAKVGLFLPDVVERQWHRSPGRSHGRTEQGVIVSMTEMASGEEIYRVTAVRTGRRATENDPAHLVAAALQPHARDSNEHP